VGPQGFAVHRKSPHWCGLLGGRKTADFLGDRTSVRVMSGSDTPAFPETALRRKNSSIDDRGQAAVSETTRMCHVRAFKMGHD
jgi:hypothetical protein